MPYLEINPECREQLKQLISTGKIFRSGRRIAISIPRIEIPQLFWRRKLSWVRGWKTIFRAICSARCWNVFRPAPKVSSERVIFDHLRELLR